MYLSGNLLTYFTIYQEQREDEKAGVSAARMYISAIYLVNGARVRRAGATRTDYSRDERS